MPISISATEMPVRIETRLATKASSIHAAATNQTLVTCAIGSAHALQLDDEDGPSPAAHDALPDVRHRREAVPRRGGGDPPPLARRPALLGHPLSTPRIASDEVTSRILICSRHASRRGETRGW